MLYADQLSLLAKIQTHFSFRNPLQIKVCDPENFRELCTLNYTTFLGNSAT
jgi:hypothetical protein